MRAFVSVPKAITSSIEHTLAQALVKAPGCVFDGIRIAFVYSVMVVCREEGDGRPNEG
jgi:hypothetical protein